MLFGTRSARCWRGGVSQGKHQELMRHSDPKLTTKRYTHLDVADIAPELNALPLLSLDQPNHELNSVEATGTHGRTAVAPNVAPRPRNVEQISALCSIPADSLAESTPRVAADTFCSFSQETLGFSGDQKAESGVETTGIEPATSWLQTRRSPN